MLVDDEPIDVDEGKKLGTVSSWGPTYAFSVDVLLTQEEQAHANNQILRFENVPADWELPGSLIPGVSYVTGGFSVASYFGDTLWGEEATDINLQMSTWINLQVWLYQDQVSTSIKLSNFF